MKSFRFGTTALGLPIEAYRFDGVSTRGKLSTPNEVLILGGVHGDEPEGVVAAYGILAALQKENPFGFPITVVPAFNLDGVLAKTRTNAHGVDLNRNLPTKDWSPEKFNPRYPPGPHALSESENQALVAWLDEAKPCFVVSLHSWKPLLNVNGACDEEAATIHELTGYTIEKDIGYPTPGCLGTYAGLERAWPTLTYEIERGLPFPEILKTHVPAVLAALKATEKKVFR